MAKLVYSAIASLDGFVADEHGRFGWAAPADEVHAFVNDLERQIGTYLYGRRMYDVMTFWETADDEHPVMRDFAEIWRAADKVVFSRTLAEPSTERTRLERDFDSAAVRRLKESSERDVSVGGSELAAEALRAGLVDELHAFFVPVVVGAGTRFLPADVPLALELLEERRFAGGTVHLHYRVGHRLDLGAGG